jgi:hypothetical protein
LFNFFVINAGVSQSSFELSGARNALLFDSGAVLSIFEDENHQVCVVENPQLFTALVMKSSAGFLIGSHRVFVLTTVLLVFACSLNHVAMIVTFTSSSNESSKVIHQIIFASGSRIF